MSVADKMGFGPKREVIENPDGTVMIRVTPHPMSGSREINFVGLSKAQFEKYQEWLKTGALLQDLLPDVSRENREVLMSGLGPKSFNQIFTSGEIKPEEK